MANQEQNPSQQEQPFIAATQVDFNLEDTILNAMREPFTRSPNMYKEYLAEFWYSTKDLENSKVSFSILTSGIYGEVWVNTFRNAIGAHYLPHSSEYVAPPSIDICLGGKIGSFDQITNKDAIILYSLANGINIDYASIFWEDIIIKLNKKHREKVVPYTQFLSLLMMHKMKEGYGDGEVTPYPTQVFSVNNWALKPNQHKGPSFTDHMLVACSAAKPVVFKAPNPSSNAKMVTKGGSSKAPTGSKTSYLKRKKESSSAMDSNPSQTSASTLVVAKMHKEDQQAIGNPKYLGVTGEERANPQLSSGYDASADSTAKADLGLSAPNDFIPQQQGMDEGTKNTSFIHISVVQPSFNDLDSPVDDPIIVVDDSDEDEEAEKDEVHTTTNAETEDASVLKSSSPRSSLPTELKELSSKFNELIEEVKGLKKQVHELEIELLGDLKEIPSKPKDFTKTVTSLTSQVVELKTLKWELQAEFLSVPTQAITSQKTKDGSIPSTGQASTQPAEGETNSNQATISQLFQRKATKNANLTKRQSKPTSPPTTPIISPVITTTTTQMQSPFLQHPPKCSSQPEGGHIKKDKGKKAMSSEEAEKETNQSTKEDKEEAKAEAAKRESELRKEELIDLLGSEVVNKYYNDKLQYDSTCDKMDPITLKEVMNACPNKTGKGWKIIYGQIQKKMDYIHESEAELGINFDIPLSEQDPLKKLNDLANKKIKHADDIHDNFNANKRINSLVQYEDHPAGTVLNEPVTLVYAADQKLKKSYKVYKTGKILLYVKRNKAISLGKGASKVGIEVQQLSLKDCT
ncbi:hypothetical protein Tco_0491531 [Tanacetum coccineum]